MNKPENISKLNDGKSHKPVKKVTTYTGYGKQRAVSESLNSVKSKQYVVNDSGTNIYISFYELSDKSKVSRKSPLRLFKEINIFDLINFQKNANTFELPIEETIFSEEGEKYDFLFTLSQNDTVKFKVEDKELIYAFNRFTGNDVYFRPINHASEIDKNEVDLKPINPKTGKNSGSQTNETTSFNGEQIKNICWKLNIDRLGNISKA
jgi:CRISPR-associated endonuclease Csn1